MPAKFQNVLNYSLVFITGLLIGYIAGNYFSIEKIVNTKSGEKILDFGQIADKETSKTTETEVLKNCDLQVEVAGAINTPGVFCFTEGSIVNKAIEEAGGLNRLAAKRYVSQRINMAEKLSPNQKVYIPFEDDLKCEQIKFIPDTSLDTAIENNNECISINDASMDELEGLSGIGEVTARKIVSVRPYGSLEQLVEKAGITEKLFEQIKSQLCL